MRKQPQIKYFEEENSSEEDNKRDILLLEDNTLEDIRRRYNQLITDFRTQPGNVRSTFYSPKMYGCLITSKLKKLRKIWKIRKEAIIQLQEQEELIQLFDKESTSQLGKYEGIMKNLKDNLNSHDIIQKITFFYRLELSLKHHDEVIKLLSYTGISPTTLSLLISAKLFQYFPYFLFYCYS